MSQAPKINWHSALISGLKIELEQYLDILSFQSEFPLNTGPRRIDCVITKAPGSKHITSPIATIFRSYNLVDYNGPSESMTIKNFYKVLSYAFSLPDYFQSNEVIDQITITFITHKYPRRLLKLIEQKVPKSIEKIIPGLYHINIRCIPVQLVILPQLPEDTYLWLHSLTDHLTPNIPLDKLGQAYRPHQNEPDYQNFMNTLIHANLSTKEGEVLMCEALYDLFANKMNEREQQGKDLMASLILKLAADNRSEDILKAAADAPYRDALMKQYGL